MATLEQGALVAVFTVSLTYLFYRGGSLDRKGFVVAVVFGLLAFFAGGLTGFAAMIIFFLSAEFFTRVGRKSKREKFERRTMQNIVGNGLPALMALLYGVPTAFYGGMAAALADTASSEIGMLSKEKPRLITTWEEVEPGTDGGVSVLGLLAAVAGSLVIGAIYFVETREPYFVPVLVLAGFAGSLVDSVLGAALERDHVVNNMEVNFLASTCGAFVAYAVSLLV